MRDKRESAKMRGGIKRSGAGSWVITLSLGRDQKRGKYRQKWVTVRGSRKDAETKRRELMRQLDQGIFMDPGKTTFGEFLTRWLTDAQANLSPRGFERYAGIVKKYLIPELGSILLTQLKPEHLEKHKTAKLKAGLSPRSVRYHHAVIHSALKTAVKWGLASRNVADAVEPPKISRTDMQTWDELDIAKFLQAARGSAYNELFTLALFTGMRRSELLALRWSDIDLTLGQIFVSRTLHHLKDGSYVFGEPKSARSRRTIALSPSTVLLLRDHRERRILQCIELETPMKESDLVFCHVSTGKPLRPNTITRAWVTLAARAGVKAIRLHDARHTHASIMLKQGIHPKIVQERLGHSSIQMTLDTYSHVAPGLQEAAAARFDELVNPKLENGASEKAY